MSQNELKKCALVTGASAGIGAAIARELVSKGYRVAITARRVDRLESLSNELNGAAEVFPADLSDTSQCSTLIESVIAKFGRLDVLVNNAGLGMPEMFHKSDPAMLKHQIDVNFTSPILLCRYALPYLISSKGTVINIGSSNTAIPNNVMGAYGATKAGLAYWNNALRRELRHRGVNVCLAEPGPVGTEFFQAVSRLVPQGGKGLEAPLPPSFSSARVEDVAARVVRLIEHPKRLIYPLRRVMLPWRMLGGLFKLWPWLGDVAVNASLRYFEHPAKDETCESAPSQGDSTIEGERRSS